MGFNRPSLRTLIREAQTDIEAELPGTTARVRRSNLNVLAKIMAGAVHGVYGYLEFIFKQFFPWSATGWWLDRWGSWWGVFRKPATFAAGNAVFSGNPGSPVPAGTTLLAGSILYATSESAFIGTDGVVEIPVTASVTGPGANLAADSELALQVTLTGVNGTARVAIGGIQNGTDVERDDELRARLVRRIQTPPQGGSADDYVTWALECPGVTRAWAKGLGKGMGTVLITFMRDNDPDPIPNPAAVEIVRAYIEKKRPVTAEAWTVAPVRHAIDYRMELTPDTPEIREAVLAELADLHHRDAIPSITLRISHIRAAISNAPGLTDYDLIEPAANVTVGANEIPVIGTVLWE
ncbi:baseplate J/gp47 family protein [Burkholderia cenocepacia]|uniref:baseplate J/gp47 family protein n=1 Tax=Burkholderia cenocepacia TaxID=95486 RepID=UPI001B9DCCE6|nr:baseplate J/gp47 family protein [Burkholderia cenocepacia]MBR8137179.1 baseplate J/gp47 family protein [Burkholderia cenocepacia]